MSNCCSPTINHSRLYHGNLGRDLAGFISQSIATSTQNTYLSGIQSYVQFCSTNRFSPFPVLEASLCFYATYQANRKISFKTIRVYIYGILHQNTLLGGNCHISSLNVLYHTLRGIRRSQGNALTRPKRSPIIISNLHSIAIYLNRSGFTAHDKSMYLASALTAFFWFAENIRIYMPIAYFF